MYTFNRSLKNKILDGRTVTSVSQKIGITPQFLSQILNGKRTCSKIVAYSIIKCLCQESEIEDYFKTNRLERE